MYFIILFYVITLINALEVRPYYDASKGDIIVNKFLKNKKIDKIIMAFILGQDCIPNFNYVASENSIKSLNNIDIWLSFGGANAPYIEQNCKNKTLLFNNLDNIIKTYNATGIDFDIENNVLPEDDQHKVRAKVLKRLKNKYRNKLTMGYTLPADEYGLNKQIGLQMLNNTKNLFIPDYINPMAMFLRDRHAKHLNDNIEKTIKSVNEDMVLIYDSNEKDMFKKMGVTVNVAGDDECPFQTKNIKELINFVKTKDMHFVSFWEIGKTHGIDIYKEILNEIK